MEPLTRSDEDLMAALCLGDKDALAGLVGRYQNDLYRFCVHYLKDSERACDMVQETFLRVYSARGRFDAARKFRPWVLRIARNLCLNELKRKKAVHMESLEEYATSARDDRGEVFQSPADGPAELAQQDERRAWLNEALETLDEEAREIVVLRFFQQMSAREIAEMVGGTEGAIRTKLHRILKSLRQRFVKSERDY